MTQFQFLGVIHHNEACDNGEINHMNKWAHDVSWYSKHHKININEMISFNWYSEKHLTNVEQVQVYEL